MWNNVPRASMPDGKRCETSLGLEKLAVGRNDLLPLRGTANSPSHLRDINMPRASIFEDKPCDVSLGLEKLAVGRNDLLPLRSTAISRERCR